jgi:hypothetical protein
LGLGVVNEIASEEATKLEPVYGILSNYMTVEIGPNDDALAQYRQLDPTLAVGGIPIAQCLELAGAIGDPGELPPDARYDWAWLALETSLAMAGSIDPSSGTNFLPKQVREATERARLGFRSVVRDPEASLATSIRAQIALAGVPIHHEALIRSRATLVSPHFGPYATTLYGAAQSLAKLPEALPEEAELADIVTAMGIVTEIAAEHAYFLLASPRQSWHINGISRHGGSGSRIAINRELTPDLTIIRPEVLTTPQLQASGELFPTLAAFARQKIGFGARWNTTLAPGSKPHSQKKPSAVELELLEVGDQIMAALNEQQDKGVATIVAAGALALAAPEAGEAPVVDTDRRPEISWYHSQPAGDAQGLPRKNFLTHLEGLTVAAESGELNPRELRTLAWMQVDNGHVLSRLAATEASAATRERSQIVRASPTRGEEHRREAGRHEARHMELLAEANAQFDAAGESLRVALTHTNPEHAADIIAIRLDAEAIPVYKALFAASATGELQRTVDSYLNNIANLAPQLRDAIKRIRRNEEQLDSILATSARAALVLLLTGATDETARHLVVPTSPRAGGRRGKADMLVFPIDYSIDDAGHGYDTTNAITLNLVSNGNDIEFAGPHIDLGKRKLAKANSAIVPLMLRLASVVRTFKGGRNKRQSHGEAMNTLALELSDAVADAVG